MRNPATQEVYGASEQPVLKLGRGYTGHEHLSLFGLVNMNARLYDPLLGRFLSPDPYVQMPDNLQNLNRYSYCLNNPLTYKDPEGELFFFTIFNAVTDAIGNMFKHGVNFNDYNWTRTENAWKIDMGMFKGNFGQVVNKWTYNYINSFIGKGVAHLINTVGKVGDVTDMHGMLALSKVTGGSEAFTIGHYSFGPKDYVADWRDHLFVHEYGHYIQSQYLSFAYFPVIAIPSLLSAWFTSDLSGTKHRYRWFEVNASKLGARYFDKRYGKRDENGNVVKDENYFDIDAFVNGTDTEYINPRRKSQDQGSGFRIAGSDTGAWDYIVYALYFLPKF